MTLYSRKRRARRYHAQAKTGISCASVIVLRLRELREALGLSQADVSYASRVGVSTLSKWERGQVTGIELATLDRLCEALGCEPGDLITRQK